MIENKRYKMMKETTKPKGRVKVLNEDGKITTNLNLIETLLKPASTLHLPLPDVKLYDVTKLGEEPRDKSIKGTRRLFGEEIQTWAIPNHTQDISSKDDVPTLGTIKPGVLLRACETAKIPHGDFSDEETGQELDFLQIALVLQPWRIYIYGFLTDTRRFQFFKAVRDSAKGIAFDRSGVYTDQDGWVALQTLLSQSDQVLGFQDISVLGWELGSWLGSGATSTVFKMTNKFNNEIQEVAVCKMYLSLTEGREQREREFNALCILADQKNVPKPVFGAPQQTQSGLNVLLKTPLGIMIPSQMRVPVSAYAPLVSTLQTAHQR
jgi:hypothetical protein